MDNKILKKPYIEFVGGSATDVTGSAYLVRFLNYHILLEYGLVQTSDDNADYVTNNKRHKDIKPKKIDYIILSHCHIDHCGLIPKLYREGCNAPLFIPKGSKGLLTIQLQDSVKIFTQEYERSGRAPLYTQEDVDKALSHVVEVDLRKPRKVNDHITFEYYDAQHIVRATQVMLSLNDGVNTKKIGFTGDISDYKNRYYLNNIDPLPKCDVLIGECTYGDVTRLHKERDRKVDVDKIRMAITNAKEHRSHIIIPTFSLNRLQDLMAIIYEMDKVEPIGFDVYIDSPLGRSISKEWRKLISTSSELWDEIINSNLFNWVNDFEETQRLVKSKKPMLVLAGGGMLSGGKAVYWCKENLSNPYNYIIFSGFATPDSIAGQLKSGKLKEIKIDGKKCKNNAKILSLNSLSSHMDNKHLLEYYTNVGYNKICLVHGEENGKIGFAKMLKEELSKANRTSKVIVVNKDTKTYF